jgi:hypothetical protein
VGAQGIVAEIPQKPHRRFRGIGADSPVFLRFRRKKMRHYDRYGRKKVNDVALEPDEQGSCIYFFPFVSVVLARFFLLTPFRFCMKLFYKK